MAASTNEFTLILEAVRRGDEGAKNELILAAYRELRRVAAAKLARESPGHTLQPTALVHEAWLRLVRQDQKQFDHRKQLYGLAAQVMRRILVDHARSAKADKRGGGQHLTTLTDGMAESASQVVELLALDEALTNLGRVSPRQAQVIELRYFGGLNVDEIADLLNVSPATVSRDQRSAEAWLSHTMSGTAE